MIPYWKILAAFSSCVQSISNFCFFVTVEIKQIEYWYKCFDKLHFDPLITFFGILGVNSNYTITIDRDEVWQRRMREVYLSKTCYIVIHSSSFLFQMTIPPLQDYYMVHSLGGNDMFIIIYSRFRVTWCLPPLSS